MKTSQQYLRLLRKDGKTSPSLFESEPDWKREWWGMPSFSMEDVSPQRQITMNFLSDEDVQKFAETLSIQLSPKSRSCWFPQQARLESNLYQWKGPKTNSKYPVCIPSKGRAELQLTGHGLDDMGVSYHFFVESTEYKAYVKALGEDRVVRLPFHDLGKGSIPARNYIWDWCQERGHKRHWIIDDNVRAFLRCTNNRRLRVRGGGYFTAMEDFVDRYENIAIAGPHEQGFVPDRTASIAPFILNSRVYSVSLIDTTLPFRWRGRYNEDTDLCLRMLKAGYCTVLFRALCMDKTGTASGGKIHKGNFLKGGNTDHVYNSEDYRKSFAESLKKQHPDVVEIVWRFGRWHHLVDYSPFKNNQLSLKKGVVPFADVNDYGMKLVRRKEKPI